VRSRSLRNSSASPPSVTAWRETYCSAKGKFLSENRLGERGAWRHLAQFGDVTAAADDAVEEGPESVIDLWQARGEKPGACERSGGRARGVCGGRLRRRLSAGQHLHSLVRNMFSEQSACRVASGSNDTGEAAWGAGEEAAEGSSAVLEARSSSLQAKGRYAILKSGSNLQRRGQGRGRGASTRRRP
jgi:hypothetical protein